MVAPVGASGKVEPATALERCVNGHKAPAYACAFSPLDADLLATAGDDCQICVWRLPADPVEEWTSAAATTIAAIEPTVMAGGHTNGARDVLFHPTVSGVLASSSTDGEVVLWNVETAAAASRLTLPAATSALDWSYDGTLLLASCRDKVLRGLDLRAPSTVFECAPHPSAPPKSFRAKWAASSATSCVLSAGPAARGGREVSMLDPRKLGGNGEARASPPILFRKAIDTQTGALLPHFSEETSVLWLFGRGDTTVRHLEVDATASTADDALHPGIDHRVASGAPHAGVAALPTRSLDICGLEVARFVRLTGSAVEKIKFTVPRTPELKTYFNDDIYAAARDGTPTVEAPARWLRMTTRSTTTNGGHLPSTEEENLEAVVDASPRTRSLRPAGMPLLSERVVEKKVLNTQLVNARLSTERDRKASDQQQYDKLKALADQYEQYQPNNSMGARPGVDAQLVDGGEVDEDEWDD
mmetsp:Transcript_22597/g.89715  ORF Transcript_22597/g.89715 Transcript_22597/m.89715 type:complete len:472 (-) Transcript_22597:72-1487(-)